jgi:2-polyprenyl-3-methyl-5-hydroxy-6-metoxy-1,4-benzoquinol methylase
VKPPSAPDARRTLALYDHASRGDRLHVRMRWWTCPFDAVEAAVPPAGRVLEVGCGHGLLSLYLAVRRPERDVVGIDIDDDKLVIARAAAATEPELRVRFERVEPDRFPAGDYDAIVFCDMLYLLPPPVRHELLDRAADRLRPGGTVVVKEADEVPRWKSLLATGQELLATKVFRITEGDQVAFAPPQEFADQLVDAGLEVDLRYIDRGYPHPHVLVTGRRPASG